MFLHKEKAIHMYLYKRIETTERGIMGKVFPVIIKNVNLYSAELLVRRKKER